MPVSHPCAARRSIVHPARTSTRDKSTESLRCVHFALRKVAPRGGGKRCKRLGSSIADLSRRLSFHRLLQQGNNRRARRVGFGGRPAPIASKKFSPAPQRKFPVKQNCAAATSLRPPEKFQPSSGIPRSWEGINPSHRSTQINTDSANF